MRLWIHEVYRVFSDRLIEEKDKEAFFEIVKKRTKDFFQKTVDEVNVSIVCTLILMSFFFFFEWQKLIKLCERLLQITCVVRFYAV